MSVATVPSLEEHVGPRLDVLEGVDAGLSLKLHGVRVVVGRHSSNALCLTDLRVSRRHCELRREGHGWTLYDLESGNGSRVNGVEVVSAELRHDDRIHIGDTVLQLHWPSTKSDDRTRIVLRHDVAFASEILKSVPAEDDFDTLASDDPTRLRSQLANLAVLYEASNLVSSELDVNTLLGRILELLLRATLADQACALLRDHGSSTLQPAVVRTRKPIDEVTVSQTIADYVLKQNHGLLLADAAEDARFRDGVSVVRHQLRQIICVPMKGRHDTVGVLFLVLQANPDEAALTEDHLKLSVAVAHQAALAIEETRYYSALIQAERLAAVGQTLAGLSHHIKNIMQGVRFGADMVRMSLPTLDRELLLKGWGLVDKNQKRIDDLILDMLSLTKERTPAKEPTDVASLVSDVLEIVQGRAAERGVQVQYDPVVLPPLACDADSLHRALLNVVSNALDVLDEVKDPQLQVVLEVCEEEVRITVSDNGPGVPVAMRDEIFKPFVSTKGSRGTGLGLPASRKAMREHGGDLRVSDADGGGAKFVFQLPRGA